MVVGVCEAVGLIISEEKTDIMATPFRRADNMGTIPTEVDGERHAQTKECVYFGT